MKGLLQGIWFDVTGLSVNAIRTMTSTYGVIGTSNHVQERQVHLFGFIHQVNSVLYFVGVFLFVCLFCFGF